VRLREGGHLPAGEEEVRAYRFGLPKKEQQQATGDWKPPVYWGERGLPERECPR